MRLREPLAVAAGLVVLAALVYGAYVTTGGFFIDDWTFADAARRAGDPVSFRHLYMRSHGNMRPLHAYPILAVERILGVNVAAHLAWAQLLGCLTALTLYAVLREAGARRLPASAAAGLLLVFPFADALHLWAASAWTNLALTLGLAGGWALLRALRTEGRAGWAWLGAAAGLDVLGVLFYEHALPMIAGVMAFAVLRGPRRAVLLRCGPVALAALLAAAVVAVTGNPVRAHDSSSIVHFGHMLGETGQLLGRSLSPVAGAWPVALALVALPVLAVAVLAWRRPERRADLRPWLVWCGVGVVVIVCGYAIFAPAVDWYVPLRPGQGNRTNASAAVGWVLLVVGLAGLVSALVARRERIVFAVAVLAVLSLWTARVRSDAHDWVRATRIQEAFLRIAERSPALNAAPRWSAVFVFGLPRATAPEVPVFLAEPDLGAALRLRLHRPLLGVPVIEGTRASCGPLGPQTSGGFAPPDRRARYGRSYFLDYPTGRTLAVTDAKACASLIGGLRAGAFELDPAA